MTVGSSNNPTAGAAGAAGQPLDSVAEQQTPTSGESPYNGTTGPIQPLAQSSTLPADFLGNGETSESTASPRLKGSSQRPTVVNKSGLPTYKNTDWSNVAAVDKAKSGVRGAYFFHTVDCGSAVVKGQEGADEQLLGTKFLKLVGFNAPGIKMVARDSSEGQQLSGLGSKEGLNERNPTHYIVMDCVDGSAYEDLDHSGLETIKSNLSTIGTLAVMDLVLGNYDRIDLQSGSFNAGNIMFTKEGELVAIDTDLKSVEDDKFPFSKLALKKIAGQRGGFEDKIQRALIDKFMHDTPASKKDALADTHFNTAEIKKGLDTGIELLRNIDIDALRINLNREASADGLARPDSTPLPKQLQSLIEHVKKQPLT